MRGDSPDGNFRPSKYWDAGNHQDHLLMVRTGVEVIPEEIMSHIIDKSWALFYSTAIL